MSEGGGPKLLPYLVAGLLLGVAVGSAEGLLVGGAYWFVFPTAWEIRLFALTAVVLDAALALVLTTVCGLVLGRRRGWPVSVALLITVVAAGHLFWNFRSKVEGLGGPATATIVAAVVGLVLAWASRNLPARLPAGVGVRPLYVVLLVLVLFLTLIPSRLPEVTARGTNVLMVVVDTLRIDRLGYAGALEVRTPVVDRLSRRGTAVEFVTTASNSTPSAIASLLTGLEVTTHGVRGFNAVLDRKFSTIAEGFEASGYRTFGFSSSFPAHLAYHQFDQGLQYRDDTSVERPCRFVPPIEGLERLSLFRVPEELGYRVLPQNPVSSSRDSSITSRAAIRFLRRHGQAPWFGLVHYYDPHAPYSPPAFYSNYRRGLAGVQQGGLDDIFAGASQDKAGWLQHPIEVRDPEFPLDAYDAEISNNDHSLGLLLAELRRRSEHDTTLVVFTADHGENLLEHAGGPNLFNHDGLYETVARVPLVMAGPGIPGGRVRRGPVRSIDLLPTIYELTDLPPPSALDGRSYAPMVEGTGEAGGDRIAVTEAPYDGIIAVRRDLFKLVRHDPGRPDGLFDLRRDPEERIDASAQYPDVHRELMAASEDRLARGLGQAPRRELDQDQYEALKALGYIDGDVAAPSQQELPEARDDDESSEEGAASGREP